MSRSKKKLSILKDSGKGARIRGNRKFRRMSKITENTDTESLPVNRSESVNDYDVCDWKRIIKKGTKNYKKGLRK